MAYYVGIGSWFATALFGFWLASRAEPGREKLGRMLIGIGALLVGYTLVLPRSGPGALPDSVLLLVTAAAGLVLLIGLFLAFPYPTGLVSVVTPPDDAPAKKSEGGKG